MVPEAILLGGPALPIGAVCDGCNHHFGSNLEAMLVRHHLIAIPLQMMAIPGKGGRPRAKLGLYERGVKEGAAITFPVQKPIPRYDANGVRIGFSFTPKVDKRFDMNRFSRALHLIAFNAAALHRGLEAVLDAQFDDVRRYVRAPRRKERWPFIEICEQLERFVPGVSVQGLELEGRDVVRLQIFNTCFYVDLLNSGCLLAARSDDIGRTVNIIGPDWVAPEEPPSDPTKHYRVSVF